MKAGWPVDAAGWYRRIKWVWLLAHGALPVLAILHVVRTPLAELPAPAARLCTLGGVLLPVLIGPAVVLWLIAESMLVMYRFPLALGGAAWLCAGFLMPFIALVFTGTGIAYSAFATVYTTLVALAVCLLLLVGPGRGRSRREGRAVWPGAVAGVAAGAYALALLAMLFPFLWAGLRQLDVLVLCGNGVLLAHNVVTTIRQLVGFSIWGQPESDANAAAYADEWQRWAAPTIIWLILAVVAAVVIAGIVRAGG